MKQPEWAKQPEWIKQLPRSIFVKLQLLFIFTGLLMTVVVVLMITHFSKVHDQVWLTRNHNRIYYNSMLADEIGNPPNILKARGLARQLNAKIRIQGGGVDFANSDDVPTVETIRAESKPCTWFHEARVGAYQGHIYTLISRNGIDYLTSYETDGFLSERPGWGPILVALVLLALLLNYLIIRWLFRPLRWLSEGVEQFTTGKLEKPIPTRENDDLGDLAKSFNLMTHQVSEMLKSKEQLLLDVSHELRSPITRIKVALELDDPDVKKQIQKNIRELEVMISELLESARLDTLQGGLRKHPVSIRSLIQNVASQYRDVKPGVSVKPIADNLVVEIDTLRVEMVLKNVLENALKYSSHQLKPVEVEVTTCEGVLSVGVRDHGFGIPLEEQVLVFEPFYRVDKSRVRETGGYGLGLSLCKKIMLAHEGSIQVASSSEQGTLLTLDFKQPEL